MITHPCSEPCSHLKPAIASTSIQHHWQQQWRTTAASASALGTLLKRLSAARCASLALCRCTTKRIASRHQLVGSSNGPHVVVLQLAGLAIALPRRIPDFYTHFSRKLRAKSAQTLVHICVLAQVPVGASTCAYAGAHEVKLLQEWGRARLAHARRMV